MTTQLTMNETEIKQRNVHLLTRLSEVRAFYDKSPKTAEAHKALVNVAEKRKLPGSYYFYIIFTARKPSWGEVMFLPLSVILFTGEGVSVQRVSLSREVCVQGGLCPGGSVSRGSVCPGGLYLGVSFQKGVSVQRGISVQRGGSLSGRPPSFHKDRAVRILLECILVLIWYGFLLVFKSKNQLIIVKTVTILQTILGSWNIFRMYGKRNESPCRKNTHFWLVRKYLVL